MSNKVLFTSYKCEKKDPIIQKLLNSWQTLKPYLSNTLFFR